LRIDDAKIQLSFHLTKIFRHNLFSNNIFRSTAVLFFLFERFFILFDYLFSLFSQVFMLFCSVNVF